MRVALVDPSLFTLPYDRMLASGLQAGGHRVTLYGRQPGPEDGGARGLDLVPAFYPLTGSSAAASLPKMLRLGLKGAEHVVSMLAFRRRLAAPEVRPDVIHFQWLPLPAADRHLLRGFRTLAPLVLTVHDSNAFNGDPSGVLQRVGAAASFDVFDRLIVHTEQGRQRLLAQGLAPERVVRVPHGLLDAPATAPAEHAEPDAMTGPITFLLFGKIKPYKGTDLLIEAFARLPEELRRKARIHVVGKPYMDLEPLRAKARLRGVEAQFSLEPRFVADEEVPALFGPGVVAVFPYREIEASGVLALAIAHGRPVLAARLGGFAELIESGRQGLLVPPEDVGELADGLRRFLEDRAFAASAAAAIRQLATEVPSWEEIGRRTEAVYVEVASLHRHRAGRSPTVGAGDASPEHDLSSTHR
jgi:glycosyltransferase involved in cell wall biosynthesis